MLEIPSLAITAGTYQVIVGAGGAGSGSPACIFNWNNNSDNRGGDNQGGNGGSGIIVIRYAI